MSNDIPEPWTEIVTRADRGYVNGGKFPTSTPKWQELVNHFDTVNARDGTDKVSPNMMANRLKRGHGRERRENLPPHENAVYHRQIAAIENQQMLSGEQSDGALAELEAIMNGALPLDAPTTHADTEGLRRHLTQHPSATAPESAGR